MRTIDVISHYKTQVAVAEALGIRQSSVASWGEFPPPLRQLQLQRKTRGRLKAEPFDRLTAKASEVAKSVTNKAQTATE